MTEPLCSVLLPSRARPERLLRTIASIRGTSDRADVEILVRLDDDDGPSLAIADTLVRDDVRVFVGQRKLGYSSVWEFYDDLANASAGRWSLVMNDDAHVVGDGWATKLRDLPTDGLLVQPEVYQLGFSEYAGTAGAFPIAPRLVWRRFGIERVVDPIDRWLHDLLVEQRGWTTYLLPGLRVVHDRDDDDALAAHRRL